MTWKSRLYGDASMAINRVYCICASRSSCLNTCNGCLRGYIQTITCAGDSDGGGTSQSWYAALQQLVPSCKDIHSMLQKCEQKTLARTVYFSDRHTSSFSYIYSQLRTYTFDDFFSEVPDPFDDQFDIYTIHKSHS